MRHILIFLLLCFVGIDAQAYTPFWKEVPHEHLLIQGKRSVYPLKFKVFELNESVIQQLVLQAQTQSVEWNIPDPEGKILSLRWSNSSVMSKGLEKKYPEIIALKGDGGFKSNLWARAEYTTSGWHAMVYTPVGMYFIEPLSDDASSNLYQVYYRKDYNLSDHRPMICFNEDGEEEHKNPELGHNLTSHSRTHGTVLRTYRLALACTYEYAMNVGGANPTKASVLSAMVTSVNRVSGVYESEFAVRLELIPNTDTFIYLTTPDPYTNGSGGAMLTENQNNISTTISSSDYDIGHVFSTGGGGIASKSSVCNNNAKARGVTGSGNPVGDPFDIDYVAHEMGHQFGADHTFNAATGSCSGNGVPSRAYEPGSGSTIMAYAGICSGNNLQSNSDAYFHTASLHQITSFINNLNSGGSCPVITQLSNTLPEVAPFAATYHIPSLTPFELNLPPANDTDHTVMTYCWEEIDRGDFGKTWSQTRFGPIFRSFSPDTINFRTFPVLTRLLNNQTNYLGEKLPDTTRQLKFMLTVRDVKDGYGSHNFPDDTVKLNVQHIGEGFEVLFPSAQNVKIPVRNRVEVAWQLGGSDAAPISCQQVAILMSTDGGKTFPITLKASTPNDGWDTVTIPNIPLTTQARIKIKAIGNVFFDISNYNFELLDSTQSIAGKILPKPNWWVYPNPAQSQIKVELPMLNAASQISFYNTTGQLLLQKVEKKSFIVDVTHWPSGIYYVSVQDPSGIKHVKQFSILR